MKRKPRLVRPVSGLGLALLLLAGVPRSGLAYDWRTDLPAAAADAREQNKFLLLDFSGSDWCSWCRRLDQEVFSTDAFQTFADQNLVGVLADFPRQTKLDPALQARNERLARRFQVQGFPAILLFAPNGELVAQFSYQPGGPQAYIQALRQAQARYALRNPNLPPGPILPPN